MSYKSSSKYDDDYSDSKSSKYDNDDKYSEGKDSKNNENGFQSINIRDIDIGDRIGGGGAGLIYRGRYKHRDVAIKTLFDPRVSPSLKREFLDELSILSKLDHENIVEFIGACTKAPDLFFVMELCHESLFTKLHVNYYVPTQAEAITWALDTSYAMQYLHSRRPCIIHRDLKSHNLLFSDSGRVKLCDFGLVKGRVTAAGTPAYMAPELFENSSYNNTIDVYAFGILLYEIFSQRIPYEGNEVVEIRAHALRGRRPDIPTIDTPRDIQDLMAQCWHKDSFQRPDFDEIVEILERCLTTAPTRNNILDSGFGDDALDDLLSFK